MHTMLTHLVCFAWGLLIAGWLTNRSWKRWVRRMMDKLTEDLLRLASEVGDMMAEEQAKAEGVETKEIATHHKGCWCTKSTVTETKAAEAAKEER